MEWVLVIFAFAGWMADGDSVALTNVPGFTSQSECQKAGASLSGLVSGTKKEISFVCLQKGKR